MEVRDVMTTDVVTAAPSMSVGDLADMLVSKRLRAVPVIDEGGIVLGCTYSQCWMKTGQCLGLLNRRWKWERCEMLWRERSCA